MEFHYLINRVLDQLTRAFPPHSQNKNDGKNAFDRISVKNFKCDTKYMYLNSRPLKIAVIYEYRVEKRSNNL